MNLFTLISLQIIKTKRITISLNLFCIFFLTLFNFQSAQAFELNVNSTNTNENIIEESINRSYQNIANIVDGTLIKKIPSLLVFTQRDAAYAVKVIKNRYLTFYSNKNEKLKATYHSGAYFIKYTHHW